MRTLQSVILSALASVWLIWPAAVSAQNADLETARSAIEKWVETQRLLTQEKRDFELAKQMLNERIELVEREIASLQSKIADTEKAIADVDKKRAEMEQENETLKANAASLAEMLTGLENRAKTLLARLPEPIRERVKPLSQRLPENPADTKQTVSLRFQNVVGILNEINKFNREITMSSEVRTLPDGSSVETAALYLGISQGYYVGAGNTVAGVGRASADGWVWKQHNAAAPAIADAIAILKNEKIATFVHLPFEMDGL